MGLRAMLVPLPQADSWGIGPASLLGTKLWGWVLDFEGPNPDFSVSRAEQGAPVGVTYLLQDCP